MTKSDYSCMYNQWVRDGGIFSSKRRMEYMDAISELLNETGHLPTNKTIARKLGVVETAVHNMMRRFRDEWRDDNEQG